MDYWNEELRKFNISECYMLRWVEIKSLLVLVFSLFMLNELTDSLLENVLNFDTNDYKTTLESMAIAKCFVFANTVHTF